MGVSTDLIVQEIETAQRDLLISTAIVAAIAVAVGAIGSLLLATIVVIPINRLVRGVELIRDTEDKEELEGHAINVRTRDELSVLQHLLLGVNAHINYDLALALRDLLAPEWAALSPGEVRQRYEDHLLVNQIIAETIDAVQDEVVERYVPAMDLVDKLLGPVDEWATARVISKWRDEVWENALALLAAENEQAEMQIREKLEQRSLQLARIFLFE